MISWPKSLDKSKTSVKFDDSDKLSAEQWKQRGNAYFDADRFHDAMQCYSKAIDLDSQVAYYFTNRALAYLRLAKWDQVLQDCDLAIQRDPLLVKGFYYAGIAHMEKGHFDEALKLLGKALDTARSQRLNFGDDIPAMIRQCKKKRFNKFEEKRIQQEITLQTYVNDAVDHKRKHDLAKYYDECKSKQVEPEKQTIEEINEFHVKNLRALDLMFSQLDDRRKNRDVPDYLCGRIGFELLKDPVITPSGITYERMDIEEHLRRVGHFDPVTRTDLKQEQLIPNLSLKEIVDSFLAENEWAVDY